MYKCEKLSAFQNRCPLTWDCECEFKKFLQSRLSISVGFICHYINTCSKNFVLLFMKIEWTEDYEVSHTYSLYKEEVQCF